MGDDCGFGCKLKGIVSGGSSRVSNFIDKQQDKAAQRDGFNDRWHKKQEEYRARTKAEKEARDELRKRKLDELTKQTKERILQKQQRAKTYSKRASSILDGMFADPPKKTRRRKTTTAKKATTTRKTTPKRKPASKPRAAPRYKSSYESIMGY